MLPLRCVVALIVVCSQLGLQVSKAGAKVWKDRIKEPEVDPEVGKATRLYEPGNSGNQSSPVPVTVVSGEERQTHAHQHPHHPHYYTNQPFTDPDDSRTDNGALSLILSVFTEKIVEEMMTSGDETERLSEAQARSLRHRLKGIYAYLKDHPALMERRLRVGSKKPQLPEQFQKRDFSFTLDIEQPVCPSRAEWRQLRMAKDINDTDVQVYQPPSSGQDGMQWFYMVTCVNQGFAWQRDCPECCIGINHVRYASSCRPKRTFVMALVRKPPEPRYDWNWIQVDTSCNCAVKPLNPLDFG